jgi:hypothetical protein
MAEDSESSEDFRVYAVLLDVVFDVRLAAFTIIV